MKRIVDVLRSLCQIKDTDGGEMMRYITEEDGKFQAHKIIVTNSKVAIEEGYEEATEMLNECNKYGVVGYPISQKVFIRLNQLHASKIIGEDLVISEVNRMYIGILQYLVLKDLQPITKVKYYKEQNHLGLTIYTYVFTEKL